MGENKDDIKDKIYDLKYVDKDSYFKAIHDIDTKLSVLQNKFDDFSETFDGLKEIVQQLTETMLVVSDQAKILERNTKWLEEHTKQIRDLEDSLNGVTKDKILWFWRTAYAALFLLGLGAVKTLFHLHLNLNDILRVLHLPFNGG